MISTGTLKISTDAAKKIIVVIGSNVKSGMLKAHWTAGKSTASLRSVMTSPVSRPI
jgi:hypothetical protein